MQPIERVLTLWSVGLLNTAAVIRWADQAILATDCPAPELIDLAFDGPERCLKRAHFEFPARPVALDFSQEFALRAIATSTSAEASALEFAEWAARNAMGENLDLPEVVFSYQLDHLLDDCRDPQAAMSHVRKELPELLVRCRELAAPFEDEANV